MSQRNTAWQQAQYSAIELGAYQALALLVPVLSVLIFVDGPHWWLGVIFLLGAIFGWFAWWKRFGLRWSPIPPTSPTARRVGDAPCESDAGSGG